MKILSLIVPSYNSEQFLDKCLASFIDDTVIDKLDIIVVNDGSTDNTAEIANRYCNKYPQSIRLINQENKGHGGALNTGCENAKGKYLKVIDADDWIETKNLSEFISKLELCDSDVVLTHYTTINVSDGIIKRWMSYPTDFERKYDLNEISENWSNFDRCFTFHGITYKTDFYKHSGYRLTEKVFYEDHEFSTFPACYAKSVYPMDLSLYCYRIGDVNQSVSEQNYVKRLFHAESVLNRFVKEFNDNYDKLYSKEFVAYKAKILLISYITTALLSERNRKNGRKCAKQIMQYFKENFLMVYVISRKKYRTLKLMHFFRMKKSTLDKLLQSKLYLKLKGTNDFN